MPTIPHSLADVSFDHSCYSPLGGGTGVGSSDPNIVEFLGDLGASFFRRSRTVPGWRRSYFMTSRGLLPWESLVYRLPFVKSSPS